MIADSIRWARVRVAEWGCAPRAHSSCTPKLGGIAPDGGCAEAQLFAVCAHNTIGQPTVAYIGGRSSTLSYIKERSLVLGSSTRSVTTTRKLCSTRVHSPTIPQFYYYLSAPQPPPFTRCSRYYELPFEQDRRCV